MSNHNPYVDFKPGDLIAAEAMNQMQSDIRQDISSQSQAAVDAITEVPSAQNADRLSGQSLEEIAAAIVDRALGEISRRSGYMRLYKILPLQQQVIVEHNLQNCPLVDVYQLDYFEVVASEDGDEYPTWVNFFLHHSSEQRIRFAPEEAPANRRSIEIQPSGRDSQPFRIPFKELLALYEVSYTDNSSVGEIEGELWEKIFSPPNDFFEDQQHAHSPWFDRCCREERSVKSLKDKGDWDDLWVKVVPRKTINYPFGVDDDQLDLPGDEGTAPGGGSAPLLPVPAPTQIEVVHLDFNRTALTLLAPPLYSATVLAGLEAEGTRDVDAVRNQLKVMVLLRA